MFVRTLMTNPGTTTQSYSWFPFRRMHIGAGETVKVDGDIYTHILNKFPKQVLGLQEDVNTGRIILLMETDMKVKQYASEPIVTRSAVNRPDQTDVLEKQKDDPNEVFDIFSGKLIKKNEEEIIDPFTDKPIDRSNEKAIPLTEVMEDMEKVDFIERPVVVPAPKPAVPSKKAGKGPKQAVVPKPIPVAIKDPLAPETYNAIG